jgi:prepilin-type N-terminal cleavage/methylation domain-containing protein
MNSKKGFTLIELMIVIAIIGILAAIAIPQFSKYRIRAYNSAAEGDCRNTKLAYEAFYADFDQYPNATAAATENSFTLQDTTNTGETVTLSNNVWLVTSN